MSHGEKQKAPVAVSNVYSYEPQDRHHDKDSTSKENSSSDLAEKYRFIGEATGEQCFQCVAFALSCEGIRHNRHRKEQRHERGLDPQERSADE